MAFSIHDILKEVKDKISVTVSSDKMDAFLELAPPEDGKNYTEAQVMMAISNKNIAMGIDQKKIKDMLDNRIYKKEIQIASGKKAQNGKDGYYNFKFNTKLDKKPKVLEDGTVDYHSLNIIEMVKEGSIIAIYIPATKGIDGYTVAGQEMIAKTGKDLPQIRGKGFKILEDGVTYVSEIEGKIEYKDNKIFITNVLELQGDVDVSTGDIDFVGDVVINGSVMTGMTVRTKGNITVHKHVEAATIIASKDVVIKSGMQGSGKGSIEAGGNVYAKFFELTDIKAKGSVNANAIMSCTIDSNEEVIISGKFGVVVGGVIKATKGITATIVGNMSEVKTVLNAGVDEEFMPGIIQLNEDIGQLEAEINKIEKALSLMDEMEKKGKSSDNNKRVQLTRGKITKGAELNKLYIKKNEMNVLLEKSKEAFVKVDKKVHPGTKIVINSIVTKVKDSMGKTRFCLIDGEMATLI